MLNDLRTRWDALEARQRLLFGGGAVLMLLLLLYEFLWYPMQTERARLANDLPRLRTSVEQFNRDATEIERLRTAGRSRGPALPLPAAIDDAAARTGLKTSIKSVQALGPDRAQVSIATVGFDSLARLLADLAQTGGITVETLQVAAADAGRVNVETLVLRSSRAP